MALPCRIVLLVTLFYAGLCDAKSMSEQELFRNLTAKYDKRFRPVKNHNTTTVIHCELFQFILLELDEEREAISFVTDTKLQWIDEHLKWNSSVTGIERLIFSEDLIWKPDMVISSSLQVDYIVPEGQRLVTVDSSGFVLSGAPLVVTNRCQLSVDQFPFDQQECEITLESWVYEAVDVDLVLSQETTYEFGGPDMKGNSEWTLLSFEPSINHYEAYGYYARVIYTARFQRQPIYYICALLVPTLLTATICLFGLFIPTTQTGERGEKVNMGLTALLALAVILGTVANTMPKTAKLPLLGVYILAEMLLCAVGVCVSIALLTAHQRTTTRQYAPPKWLIRVLFLGADNKEHHNKTMTTSMKTAKLDIEFSFANQSLKLADVAKSLKRLEDFLDRKERENDFIVLWHKIFDRVDAVFLISFQLANVLVTTLLF